MKFVFRTNKCRKLCETWKLHLHLKSVQKSANGFQFLVCHMVKYVWRESCRAIFSEHKFYREFVSNLNISPPNAVINIYTFFDGLTYLKYAWIFFELRSIFLSPSGGGGENTSNVRTYYMLNH